MSVREYIGARYVPVFAEPAEWDATKTYEPLTVVMYQGSSYTSRQAVPANISIENETYWALTGNYNAQIEQYRQEVAVFDQRITQNANDIDTLEAKLPTASFSSTNTVKKYVDDNITTLRNSTNTSINAANTSISTIEGMLPKSAFSSTNTVKKYVDDKFALVSDWSSRFVLFLGDSYAVQSSKWPDICAANLGLDSAHYLNVAVSGASFNGQNNTPKYVSQLSNSAALANADKVTDIVLCAGINDCAPQSTSNTQPAGIHDSVVEFVDACHQLYPNAIIHAGFVGVARMDSSVLSGRTQLNQTWGLYNWFNECRGLGINYLNGSENLMRETTYFLQSDGLHPNDYGAKAIGNGIAQALRTGSVVSNEPIFPYSGGPMGVSVNNNVACVRFRYDFMTGAHTLQLAPTDDPTANLLNTWTGLRHYFNEPIMFPGVLHTRQVGTGTIRELNMNFVLYGMSLYYGASQDYSLATLNCDVVNLRIPEFTVPTFSLA